MIASIDGCDGSAPGGQLDPVSLNVAVVSVHGCPCIPPGGLDAGGMNVYVRETGAELARLGHEVTVFARQHLDHESSNSPVLDGADLVHVPAGDLRLRKDEVAAVLPEFGEWVQGWSRDHRKSFDVIAAHYWFSGVVAAYLKSAWSIPFAFSYHTMAATKLVADARGSEPPERLDAEREISLGADRIVVWTNEEAEVVRDQFGVPCERVVVSSPGVDCKMFAPAGTDGSPDIAHREADRGNVIYVGRLDAFKGVVTMLDAFAIVVGRRPNTRLVVAGDGGERQRLLFRDALRRRGLTESVEWLGTVAHDEMPAVYATADVMLAPSHHETFGLAALEAAACGLPVVAADVDGLRSVVEDGVTGYLVDDRDPEVYAARSLEILGNRDLRRELSRASRSRAELRSWEMVALDLERIYCDMIDSASVPSPARG